MRKYVRLSTITAFAIALWAAVPAYAQTRTWVSGTGSDSNPCSRTSPCLTFAGALSKTAAGGEINCIDPGGFGNVTISNSITISCENGTAGVLASGTNGIVVNAGATDTITLKGLDINGAGTGLVGVKFLAGGRLSIQSCVIRNFSSGNGLGIAFTPNSNATMSIVDTVVQNNGNASSGGGIQVASTASASANAILNRVTVDQNFVGVAALGGGAAANMTMFNSTIGNNGGPGAIAVGTGGVIRVGSSAIANNGGTATSGNVLSFLNNQISGNNPDTTPATAGGLR